MNNTSDRQRGGVLAFLLVGVLLTALLAGGIYVSKNQGRNAAIQPVATNTKPDDSKKTADTPKEQVKNPADDKAKPDQATPKPTPPATPAPTTPKPAVPSTPNTAPSQPSGIANTGPTAIASTGPADVLVSIVALAVTAGSVSAYRSSVQRMRLAALK